MHRQPFDAREQHRERWSGLEGILDQSVDPAAREGEGIGHVPNNANPEKALTGGCAGRASLLHEVALSAVRAPAPLDV